MSASMSEVRSLALSGVGDAVRPEAALRVLEHHLDRVAPHANDLRQLLERGGELLELRERGETHADLEGTHGRPRRAGAAAARVDVENAQRRGRRHLREREQRPRLVPHEGHQAGREHAAGDAADLAEGARLLLEQFIYSKQVLAAYSHSRAAIASTTYSYRA